MNLDYLISLLETQSNFVHNASQEFLISLLLRPFIIDWRNPNMLLSVPLVSLDCVCNLISLAETQSNLFVHMFIVHV